VDHVAVAERRVEFHEHVAIDRFWLPLNSSYELDDQGWLAEPGPSWFGLERNPSILSDAQLTPARCLVLLGEPGMGKTHAVHNVRAHDADAADGDSPVIDLGRLTTESLLTREAFESEVVENWIASDSLLVLYLDSFDEARTQFPELPNLFRYYLANKWPVERLALRVVCRTAEWPTILSEELHDLYGDGLSQYELVPLRKSDAVALVPSRVDAGVFLDAVQRTGLAPLAARPLTLRLLVNSYVPGIGLPERVADIYERGLAGLCDEWTPRRRAAVDPVHALTPSQRLDSAARLGVLSALSGRTSLWTGPSADATSDCLTVDDYMALNGGEESSAHGFNETLRTGIFTRQRDDAQGWSHATFADFLAARWIVRGGLEQAQTRAVLCAPDGHIFPQVQHLAAWLVAIDPVHYAWLAEADPEAFLLGVDIPDGELRAAVVRALLDLARRGELFYEWGKKLHGLTHAGLGGQLSDALRDSSAEVKRVAIAIARQCKTSELVDQLTALGRNVSEPTYVRVPAIMAVYELEAGNRQADFSDVVSEIRASAGTALDTEQSELIGAALQASWPHAVSTAESFSVVEFEQPKNFLGLYGSFVGDMAKGLTAADLDAGLAWLDRVGERATSYRLRPLADAVVALALNNLDHPRALTTIAAHARRLCDSYEPLFEKSSAYEIPAEARRKFALELMQDGSERMTFAVTENLGGHGLGLLKPSDFGWLVDLYPDVPPDLRDQYKLVLRFIHRPDLRDHIDILLNLPPDHPVATDVLAYWLASVDLNSPEAESQRDNWAAATDRRRRSRHSDEPDDSWINPKIAEWAAAARAGDNQAFWLACRHIHVRPGTAHFFDEHQPDLTAHPRWGELDEVTRGNMEASAPRYLREADCERDHWLGKGIRYFPAEAGYQALVLLLRVDAMQLRELPGQVWKEWAPIIISWATTTNGAEWTDKKALLDLALPVAGEELRSAALVLITKAVNSAERSFLTREAVAISSREFCDALLGLLANADGPEARGELLDVLLDASPDTVRPVLLRWVAPTGRTANRDRAREAAIRLLNGDAPKSWPTIRDLMEEDAEFMEEAFLGANLDRQAPAIDETSLADLYLWLVEHFPRSEDPSIDEAHYVGPREQLAMWRDSIFRVLVNRGTEASIAAVARIGMALPEETWLQRALSEARAAHRSASWQPLTTSQISGLAASRRSRLVRSSAELLFVTVEALLEIQARLQGDTPDAAFLWDSYSRRPKEEDEISDFLRNRLQERLTSVGVVVNREVQVNRIKGIGERTDLRVDAVSQAGVSEPREVITIVGEVKGCWYSDLVTPVRAQLVDRYMSRVGTTDGIYVIVWFDLDSWDDGDGRKQTARNRTPQSVDVAMNAELADLHSRGYNIRVVHLDASRRRRAKPATEI
jgi:hypothetical protein